MDHHKILNRHSWSPEDEPNWLWWSPDFLFRAASGVTALAFSELFWQMLPCCPTLQSHSVGLILVQSTLQMFSSSSKPDSHEWVIIRLDDKPTIWMRCAGIGKHLWHAGQGARELAGFSNLMNASLNKTRVVAFKVSNQKKSTARQN